MASIHETGAPLRTTESAERVFPRQGVVMVLANRDLKTQKPSIFVVQHHANPTKGIRENDLGLPSETIEFGENPIKTMGRLLVEEIGISPNEIKVFVQQGHQHLELKLPQHGIRAHIVVLWLIDIEQLRGARPKDTTEVESGFFLPVDDLFPVSRLPLRRDLHPALFLGPLIEKDFLSPNGGFHPANLNTTIPLNPRI